jgi:hypothetical protein
VQCSSRQLLYFLMGDKSVSPNFLIFGFVPSTKLKGSNYLKWSHVAHIFLKAHGLILFLCKTFGCLGRFSGRSIKQCSNCGCHYPYVDWDHSSYIPMDQVLISKTKYDLLLQRSNASSSSLIVSSNTCLHSSSSPS